MYLVFHMFTAKPISLQAFNNTSAFLSIVLISPPIKSTYIFGNNNNDVKMMTYNIITWNLINYDKNNILSSRSYLYESPLYAPSVNFFYI